MKLINRTKKILIEKQIDELMKKRKIIVDLLFYEGKYTAQARSLTAQMAQNSIKISKLREEWRTENGTN